MAKEKPQQLSVELPQEIADGVYANLALITHSPAEFVIDFSRIMPGIPKAKVHSRIIMAPTHAKALLDALKENIRRYESQFGEIKQHRPEGIEGMEYPPPSSSDPVAEA